MVGGAMIGGNFAPESGREDDHRKQEEDSCDFEPENSAGAAKGAQKTADPAGDCLAGLAECLSSLHRCARTCFARADLMRAANWNSLRHFDMSRDRPRWSETWLGDTAGRNARGNAHSDAERAADSACSHTVYDGSSGLERPVFMKSGPGSSLRLPSNRIGSKVERIQAAARMEFRV